MSRTTAYLIVFAVAMVTTLVATPVMRRLAIRTRVVQAPDERRVHERPTPLLGGLAMGLGLVAGMAVAWRLDALHDIFFLTNGGRATEPIGLLIAAVMMLVVGTIDDVREVSAPAKTAGTVLCASVLFFAGISLLYFRFPRLGVFYLDPNWSYLLSVIWVFGMSTAINFIDGLDGLAAGIVAIASGAFFLYTLHLGEDGIIESNNIAPLIAVIVLAMCLGFLPFNFHPARIFMGDGGALLLGLMMAAATMVVGGRIGSEAPSTSGLSYFFFAPLLIPLVILGVPIFDTMLSIVRRAAKRTAVSTADKEHVHHRLMRLGHGQRRSVLILWAWTALLSALVLYPTYTNQGTGTVPILIAALALVLYTVLHPGARSARDERRQARNGDGGPDGAEPAVGTAPEPAAVGSTPPATPDGAEQETVDLTDGPSTPRGSRHGRRAAGGRHYRPPPGVTPEEALARFDHLDRADEDEPPSGE
jgi:UDP-GlcNAc:undecaprenyl-phosphate GlcNAc-1-phosphate transferase